MAQPQIFDYAALHRIGSASAGGVRRYKPERQVSALERFAFQFLGSQVMDYVSTAKARKQKYQDENINFQKTMAKTISEDEFTGNSDVATAIQEFSLMRDEGQRLVSKYHGFTNSKKYKKGVAMMNAAQTKLENLQTSMTNRLTFNNNLSSVTLNGYYLNSKGEKVYAELDENANSGPVKNRGYASMNGDLDKSISVNRETGFLQVAEENWDNVTRDKNGQIPEDAVPEIKITPWNELKLPNFMDKSGYGLSTAAGKYGTTLGSDGLPFDEVIRAGTYDMGKQSIDGMSRTAFNSWFFNGTHYNFGDAGTTFTTPAEAFIEKKYGFEKDSVEWKGAMEQLRGQNLSEIDGYREFAINHYVEVAEQYHGIAKAAYDKKHAKTTTETQITKHKQDKIDNYNKGINMLRGKNVQFDDNTGGMMRYNSDGKGMTKVYIRTSEPILDKDDNEIGTNYGWDLVEEIPTNQALKQRNLDIDIPEEYLYPAQKVAQYWNTKTHKYEDVKPRKDRTSEHENPISDYDKIDGKWYFKGEGVDKTDVQINGRWYNNVPDNMQRKLNLKELKMDQHEKAQTEENKEVDPSQL